MKDYKFILVAFLPITLAAGILIGQSDLIERERSIVNFEEPVAKDLPDDLDYSSVEELYDVLREKYDGDLDEEVILNELKHALAEATGDPYTEYFTADEATDFRGSLEGTFSGIGAELGRENDSIIVVSPLKGFPAEAAGLRPQDVIVRIDEEDSTGFTISEAVGKIRGETGTDVTLTVVRDQSEVIEITITRATIDIPSVTYETKDTVGVISIAQFSSDTTDLLIEAVDDLKGQGVDKIVLDMRGNPGGFLDQAVTVLGVWLENGQTAVEIRRGGTTTETLRARGSQQLQGVETVVLINGGSASASEIVAGALKDFGAATIVGETSFGKGSVQNTEPVGDNNNELLKVTTARWYTPNGTGIDKEGIEPDEVVELTAEDFDADRDPQLDRALEILLN